MAIVGDITHSRVARSDLYGLARLGARARVCGPPTMIPPGIEALGATVHHDLREAVEGADAVDHAAHPARAHRRSAHPQHPRVLAALGAERAQGGRVAQARLPSSCTPGPSTAGSSSAPDVADGPRAVILDQVENGVAVRMALLYLLAGGAASRRAEAV